jgi:hypothetical protein
VKLLAAIDVRAIEGHDALSDDRASRLSDWADVVVLWGEARLHPTVTDHFTPAAHPRATVIAVEAERVAALLDETAKHLPYGNRSEAR